MYPLHQSPLYKLKSKKRMLQILQVSNEALLEKILQSHDKSYRFDHQIKSNGEKRFIEEPPFHIKKIQKRISDLLHKVEKPDYLFSPCKKKSSLHNAQRHRLSKHCVTLDIKNYFPSITSGHVFQFFQNELCCGVRNAGYLKDLTTVNSHLPIGAPSSPLLAFYTYKKLWDKIETLSQSHNCIFTLFADDLTISGEHIPKGLIWEIKQKIHSHGLKYHKEKVRKNRDFEVTGAVIKIKKNDLVLPHRKHKKVYDLRASFAESQNQIHLKSKITGHLGEFKFLEKIQASSQQDN